MKQYGITEIGPRAKLKTMQQAHSSAAKLTSNAEKSAFSIHLLTSAEGICE